MALVAALVLAGGVATQSPNIPKSGASRGSTP